MADDKRQIYFYWKILYVVVGHNIVEKCVMTFFLFCDEKLCIFEKCLECVCFSHTEKENGFSVYIYNIVYCIPGKMYISTTFAN